MKQGKETKYGWSGTMNSGGGLSLGLSVLPDEPDADEGQLLSMLAESIQSIVESMESKGYVSLSKLRLMSSREMSEEYGNSRQYWEKLLREGKIPFYKTAAGRISVDIYVQAYLDNKDKVDQYVNNVRKAVREIKRLNNDRMSLKSIECPACQNESLSSNWNVGAHEANGVCREPDCDFRFQTSIE